MAEMRSMLQTAADMFGDRPALVSTSRTLSWQETADQVALLVAQFEQMNIGQATPVALSGATSVDYLLSFLACFELGAIACPQSPRLTQAEQSRGIELLKAVVVDTTAINWPEIRKNRPNTSSRLWSTDHVATIISTSGSSGRPKMAALTIGNHYYNALGSNDNIPFAPPDRWLLSLPLYHVGGIALIFRAMLGGGALVIAENGTTLVQAVIAGEVSHVSVVPTLLYRLLSQPRELVLAKTHLKAILIGGGPVSPLLIDRALEAGLPIYTSYGLTEMGSQVTTTAQDDPAKSLFTSGKLLKHRELSIADDGEILVRGETRFAGYVSGDGLVQPFDTSGWFATGDIGSMSADGFLTVLGRKDNMFVSGGENIHPEEIEVALGRMPEILEAVVVSIEDDEYGRRPVAFVRLLPRSPFDETKLAKFLERFLPKFKVPDEFFPWPDDAPIDALKPDRRWFERRAVDLLNR